MLLRRRSYEVLPALSVRGPELRRSLRLVTVAWMFGVVWMSLAFGSHVPLFARRLGFRTEHFGYMAAIPPLSQFAQLAAVLMIERTGLRKYHFLLVMTLSRVCWILIALIPFVLPIPSPWAVWAMLIVLTLAWTLAALGMPSWTTWMSDLIPRRIRGRYLAVRTRITRVVQIVAVIAVGILLDQVTAHQPRDVLLWTVCGLFVLASLFGVVDILLFLRVREVLPTTAELPRQPAVVVDVPRPARGGPVAAAVFGLAYVGATLREFILVPMRDRGFRYYVGYSATMAVAMSVAGPFFWLYCLEQLGFAKLAVNLAYMVVAPLAAIGAARIWGTLMDRWGRRPTLFVATGLVVFSAMPYFFCTPTLTGPAFVREGINWISGHVGALWGQAGLEWIPPQAPVGAWLWVALSCTIGGAGWSGVMLAQMGVLMSFADGPHRGRYVAGSAALIGLGGMLGGFLGGQVAQALSYLSTDPIRIGSLVWTNLHATFALSCLARFTGLLWLLRMPDPGSGRIRDLVRQMRTSVFDATTRLYYSFRLQSWTRMRRNRRRDDRDDGPEDERG